MIRLPLGALSTLELMSLTSCNLFDPLDSPSGDEQHLSAARACFDKSDFSCAVENYNKVSGTYAQSARAKQVYATLDQNGVSIGTFLKSFGKGDGSIGVSLTKLANELATGAGATKRVALFEAYQSAAQVTDSTVGGMARFLTATALLAEILAEDAGTDNSLAQADLVGTPASCPADGAGTGCLTASTCDAPSGKNITLGSTVIDLDTATSAEIEAAGPTLYMLLSAARKIKDAIEDVGGTGRLSTNSLTLIDDMIDASVVTGGATQISRCLRHVLIDFNIGKTSI